MSAEEQKNETGQRVGQLEASNDPPAKHKENKLFGNAFRRAKKSTKIMVDKITGKRVKN